MAVKIGTEIVIYDDMVFRIGYGDPAVPLDGMIRYNYTDNDFEFHIDGDWRKSGIKVHPLYNMIRYNDTLKDFEFLVDGVWTLRCDCGCPDPAPCPPCTDPDPCPDSDPCPPCPDFLTGPPDRTRNFTLVCDGEWTAYKRGGPGVTYDMWDLSDTPIGKVIDFRFQTYILPDRFMIEYPMGNLVYDSGWRSTDPDHDMIDVSLYSSAIMLPGGETVSEIVTRGTQSTMRIIIIGAYHDLTDWSYGLRCHDPH